MYVFVQYVLRALSVDEDLAHSSIRFGFGRFTTEAEVCCHIFSVLSLVSATICIPN
jgi:cysteine desulfurase